MTVKDFLNSRNIGYKEIDRPNSGLQYLLDICPKCGENYCCAIGVNGLFNCFRSNKCAISGNFDTFIKLYGIENIKLDEQKPIFLNNIQNKKYNLPKIIPIKLSNLNRKYLNEIRYLDNEIIDKFGLFNGIKGEIMLPHKKHDKIVNIKHFIPPKNGKKKQMWEEKGAERCLFNQDNVKDYEYVTITEGQIDCMTLVQYGLSNVVSIPNGVSDLGWIENDFEFLDKFKEIYICMDNDQAGQDAIKPIVARLGNYRVKSIQLPHKDANECLINKVTKEEILAAFENASEFGPVELVSAGIFCEEVLDMFRNPKKFEGMSTGFPELDISLKGWRKGETTIWSGQNGSGKSTILNQICLLLGKKGAKCCIASLELRPARYLHWAVQQAAGCERPSDEVVVSIFEWFSDWFYVLDIDDSIHMDKLFDIFEYTYRRYGAEHFIIDSLMRIKLNETGTMHDEIKSQEEFVSRLVEFDKKYNVHGHLVCHPRKLESDLSRPTKADIKGGGGITDLCDNCIILWRVPEKDKEKYEDDYNPDAMLFIRKNREFGVLSEIPLRFDSKSRRYSCLTGETEIY